MNDETLRLACELALAARRRAAKRRRRAPSTPAPRPCPQRSPTQRSGDRHEAAALRLLLARGLTLLARNLRTPAGEIDLAMRDGDTLVFVEVRARRAGRYGGAAASIGAENRPGWHAPPPSGCPNWRAATGTAGCRRPASTPWSSRPAAPNGCARPSRWTESGP